MPALDIAVLSAAAEDDALAPELALRLRLRVDPPDTEVFAVLLRTQVRLLRPAGPPSPGIVELFGGDGRTTCRAWMRVDTLVSSFRGESLATLALPCSFDAGDPVARWFESVGELAPLRLLFSGSIVHRRDGAVAVVPIAHDCEAEHRVPVELWRALRRRHLGDGASVRVSATTLGRLRAHRDAGRLADWDQAIADLLDRGAS